MTRTAGTWIALIFLLITALMSSACYEMPLGSARDTVHKTFRVEPGGLLTLDSDSGSVEISPGTTNEVRVDVEREVRGATDQEAAQQLSELQINFRQDGKDVSIQVRHSRDHFAFNWGNRVRLHFVVTVPNQYNLELKTGGGSINVLDLEGRISARTSGGNLNFGKIQGPINAHTSGGSIAVEGSSGPVEVGTSGGNIRIGKVSGPVKAHTSGGSISLDEVQGDVQASTSGGNVDATITRQPEGDCELGTSGGSIHARLARDLNLNLNARTGGGSVRTDIPVTIQGEVNRHRLEAKMNQGGPQLTLHTSGGNISIDSMQ